jgi:hypothetical protein
MADDGALGVRRDRLPLPHVPEDTTYFEAGALSFGVEFRELKEKNVRRALALESPDARPPVDFSLLDSDGGVSIHVFASQNLDEYLRFDCFATTPHYHYVWPGSSPHHVRIIYDTAANGDMLTWSFAALRDRLGPLLDVVGASALLRAIDPQQTTRVLAGAEDLARRLATAQE